MIRVRDITKTYGKRRNRFIALKNVSFEVPEGTSVAIMGKSGSGKSTLMHAISGLDKPEQGEVLIGEQNILKLRGRKLDKFRAHQIGFIFQSFFVQANESCYHNTSLPLEIAKLRPWKRKQLIVSALEKVEMLDKIHEPARNLSGGQKQRLAIARAIVGSPTLIFADEPTGNLDSVTGGVIIDLLFNLNRQLGSTLFIVTHDHELAARCQVQIQLKDGEIVSVSGSPKADRTQPLEIGKVGKTSKGRAGATAREFVKVATHDKIQTKEPKS